VTAVTAGCATSRHTLKLYQQEKKQQDESLEAFEKRVKAEAEALHQTTSG
jgi:hypothetical protein